MTYHRLKTLGPYWDAVADGRKTFEVRRNDRSFEVGYVLALVHHDQNTSSNPMQQVNFFRRRTELRENAELEAKNTTVEPLLKTYLKAFFHGGTPEELQEYAAAKNALVKAAESYNKNQKTAKTN